MKRSRSYLTSTLALFCIILSFTPQAQEIEPNDFTYNGGVREGVLCLDEPADLTLRAD